MSVGSEQEPIAHGRARQGDESITFEVDHVDRYSLGVRFPAGTKPERSFASVELKLRDVTHELGKCDFEAEGTRADRGRLFPSDTMLDFGRLERTAKVRTVAQDFRQLPLLLGQLEAIRPEFRSFVAELTYELQVYRKVFDDIDRGLELEPAPVAEKLRRRLVDERVEEFNRFFDERLRRLEVATSTFSRAEHERHGYYFRRQVWDLILRSAFLSRTNLRPRGYAGDSVMMRWIYERDYVGEWVFDRLMHRHPVESAAAQAVRNRRAFLPQELRAVRDAARERGDETKIRFMSVACGPAWELRDLFDSAQAAEEYEGLLLDQDDDAIAEARAALHEVRVHLGRHVDVNFARDSVRTMLRTADLGAQWGQFHLVYSMGLFDYLNGPVASAVLAKLYTLLRPGGQLIIGNYHVDNPTATYMNYWMDWSLIYRDEQEMLDMAAALPGAEAEVVFEGTRSQMFLRVRRGR